MNTLVNTWNYPIRKKTITFCVTCRNRLWQLKQTLGKNLESLDNDLEITLIDYGSTDEISEWVWGNFKKFIDNEKLNFFEVKNEVVWNASKAKNLAHRISNGSYLFNLDADNFIASDDLKLIRKSKELGLAIWQFAGDLQDGSYGRIGCPREMFFKLGGYDETMLPMGGQDHDFLLRLNKTFKKNLKKIAPPKLSAIKNSHEEKVLEIVESPGDAESFYRTMNRLNLNKSKFRLATEGPLRKEGFATFKGVLNGSMVVINGFDEIRTVEK